MFKKYNFFFPLESSCSRLSKNSLTFNQRSVLRGEISNWRCLLFTFLHCNFPQDKKVVPGKSPGAIGYFFMNSFYTIYILPRNRFRIWGQAISDKSDPPGPPALLLNLTSKSTKLEIEIKKIKPNHIFILPKTQLHGYDGQTNKQTGWGTELLHCIVVAKRWKVQSLARCVSLLTKAGDRLTITITLININ